MEMTMRGWLPGCLRQRWRMVGCEPADPRMTKGGHAFSGGGARLGRIGSAGLFGAADGGGAAQVELDYVAPRHQGFTLGEFVYRGGGPFAARGYRRVIAPPRMLNAGDYLTEVGFRPEGGAMVLDLT